MQLGQVRKSHLTTVVSASGLTLLVWPESAPAFAHAVARTRSTQSVPLPWSFKFLNPPLALVHGWQWKLSGAPRCTALRQIRWSYQPDRGGWRRSRKNAERINDFVLCCFSACSLEALVGLQSCEVAKHRECISDKRNNRKRIMLVHIFGSHSTNMTDTAVQLVCAFHATIACAIR